MDMFVTILFTIGIKAVIVMIGWVVVDYINKRNEEKSKRQSDYDKIIERFDHTITLFEEINSFL